MTLHLVVNVTISVSFMINVFFTLKSLHQIHIGKCTKDDTAKRRRKHTKDKRKRRKLTIKISYK